MKSNLLLITKDVLRSDYLRPYNNQSYFDTPNISKLASNGTVFKKYYASAPTTNLAAISMFTGKPIHLLDIKSIDDITRYDQNESVFSHLERNKIKTYVLWSREFKALTNNKIKVFDNNTIVHFSPYHGVKIAPQAKAFGGEVLKKINNIEHLLTNYFFNYIKTIQESIKAPWFIWCHCPHVFYPGRSYGSDIKIFDDFIGNIMNEISAEIIISADHGHQNCEKGRIAYGYDLYEPAVHIPLITPNYFGESEINFLVDQSQLMNIIINKKVEQKEFIYSDTRFYQQYDRKLSIYRNRYKYIYNKIDNSEELYDLDFDPHENVNLLIKNVPDFERKVVYPLDELYFYPHWEYAEKYYSILLNEKHKIWRQGNLIEETIDFLKSIIRNLLKKGIPWLFKRKRNTIKIKGRWDSNARIPSV